MDTISEIICSVPELSSWAFISLCLVSFFTSLVSATFGLGGGTMLVAIMASLLNPIATIPIHGVIQINSNLVRSIMLRAHIKFVWALPFVIGSIVGVSLASQIVFAIPRNLFQGIIGLFILYSLWTPSIKALKSSWIIFIGIGVVSSFATMFVGGTGLLVAPFVKATTNERRMTVATHAAFMSCQHGVKILTFGLLGFTFAPYLPLMVIMIILGTTGTWVGKSILTKISEKLFRLAFNTMLILLATRLIYQSIKNGLF
ncbi:hypothetical protein CMK19_17020 [Candidatus Poribacteria bacterium]|nr:hypothetical protein [Candidatus Poribacteria bacterium]MEE2909499.1 sulfite exporter TauE/SafE family protein [Candidatus Poribacteria bacterium]|tara:strand:+ start:1288 stop:2061 length:774 start_codon:yes stop_codon:yes gene_type:complete